MKIKTNKLFIIIMTFLIVITFTACDNPEEDAKTAVDTTLNALKSGDEETISKLFVGTKDLQAIIDENSGQDTSFDADELNKLFSNLTYEIKDSEVVNDSTVNVTVDVSNVNMSTVISAWYVDVVSIALENYDVEDSQLNKLFFEAFEEEIVKTAKNKDLTNEKLVIEVVKENDMWVLNPTADLIDKLTGGLISAFNNVEGDTEQ